MKCTSGHRLRYIEPLQTWTHPDATSWCSAGYELNDKDGDPGMSPIPTNPDGKPAGPKPPNPPTSASGVSGEPVGPYAPTRDGRTINQRYEDDPGLFEAGYRQGWRERDMLGEPRYPDLAVDRVNALARDARAAAKNDIETTPCDLAAGDLIDRTCACGHSGTVHHRDDQGGFVCDMCPIAAASDAPLREWLAEQFATANSGHVSTATRIDGLVDVVLRQEQRLTERMATLNPTVISQQAIDDAFERGRQQGDTDRAARAQSEYDRGVADGRASISNLASGAAYQRGLADGRDAQARDNPNEVTLTLAGYSAAKQAEFEHGLNIGKAEREAELLDQGWTPPGAIGEMVRIDYHPSDYEVWRDALTASASNVFPINGTGEAGTFDDDRRAQIRDEAVWFYRELKAGPPPDLIDPADQAQETRAAANPADLDDDVDHTQDPNDPTSAY